MKKLILAFSFCFVLSNAFGVAAKVIASAEVTFHNYSGGNFDVTGCTLTVDNNQYPVGSLSIISGSLNTGAGTYLTFGGLSIPTNKGSLALWYPGTDFNNLSTSDLITFVQWGAAGQQFESIAVTAGLWAASTFVNSTLPINRDGNYNSWGAGNWSSGLNVTEFNLEDYVEIGPMPFKNHINLIFTQGHRFEGANIYNVLGKLVQHMNIMQSTALLTISTEDLANGIYFIELQTSDGQLLVNRLVKR